MQRDTTEPVVKLPWPKRFVEGVKVLRHGPRALKLVWQTSRSLLIGYGLLTLFAGVIPAGIAYVGKLIVDTVIIAIEDPTSKALLWQYIAIEGLLVLARASITRGLGTCRTLLRAQLGQKVNVIILEKALTLELQHFEDSEFYDKLTRARRQASTRPLSLVNRTFGAFQSAVSLITYFGLLWQFSPWAVLILVMAAIPAFVAETRFSGAAFRLFSWRAPEKRQQMYLETVIAREDFAKEIKLFAMGQRLLDRYKGLFDHFYDQDRNLTLRRDLWGLLLGTLSTVAFYGTYAWVAWSTVEAHISLGEMTMYLAIFRQAQNSFSSILADVGGVVEDNLYLSNLYEYLDQPVPSVRGTRLEGSKPGTGLVFENVSYTYPGANEAAIVGVSFALFPGEKLALVGENGCGKTTLVKLMTRLYSPTEGRILLDGTPLEEWSEAVLRRRMAPIFQDFVRYQFKVGENIGAGDERFFDDANRWPLAAQKGQASPFIDQMPKAYETQLGRWFKGGRELSGGQWQKIALSRVFMREGAELIILDEPTAAMDAEAEARLFEQLRELTQGQMAVVISHRFSTVRMADNILVMDKGAIVEAGTHEVLMELGGNYARLFSIQAEGYQ